MRWTPRVVLRVFDAIFLVHDHRFVVSLNFQDLSCLSVINMDLRSRGHNTLGSYQTRISRADLISGIHLVFILLERICRKIAAVIHIE